MKKFCLLLVGLIGSFYLAGCAGPAVTVDDQLHATRQVLNEARANKLDKQCPDEYKAALALHKKAVKMYMSCKCEDALPIAKEAYDKAKALCPEAPAPAPAPAPTPQDSDGDGVLDCADRCPNTPRGAKVNEQGCWVLSDVLFAFDSAEIRPEFTSELDAVAAVLKANPGLKVEVQGHTDSVGSEAYNKKLSLRRAQAVVNYLVSKGVDPARLKAEGYGSSMPIASNDTPEGRAKNRRVQFVVIK